MLPLPLIVAAALLAPLGYARIAAFVINHAIFGHRRDVPVMKWTLLLLPPLLSALTLLFIPFVREFGRPVRSGYAEAGESWLLIAAAFGAAWIVERLIQLHHKRNIERAVTLSSRVVRLRKAHIPYASLQRLGLHNDVYDLEVNIHRVFVHDLPEVFVGYRIAFLSDLHVASFMRRALYTSCNEQIAEANVDLVILGGDYVTWRRHIPLMAESLMSGLSVPDGIFAVLGNHDYWADADGVVAALTARGVKFLHNQSVAITRGEEKIFIAGIDEIYRGNPDVDAALANIPASAPRIVVSHHPDIVDKIAWQRIDLLLCGHTHGGQIRLPFFGPLLVPSVHETRYAAGFFELRNLLMYVGRGVGAVPPVRILCRPELPIFELTDVAPTE